MTTAIMPTATPTPATAIAAATVTTPPAIPAATACSS